MNPSKHLALVYIMPVGLFFLLCCGCGSTNETAQVIEDRIMSHVDALASPLMEGRETGTNGEKMAAAWLDSAFRSLDLVSKGDVDAIQTFHYKPHPPCHAFALADVVCSGTFVSHLRLLWKLNQVSETWSPTRPLPFSHRLCLSPFLP